MGRDEHQGYSSLGIARILSLSLSVLAPPWVTWFSGLFPDFLEKIQVFLEKTRFSLENHRFFLESTVFPLKKCSFSLKNHSFSLKKPHAMGSTARGACLGCQVLGNFRNSWEFTFPSLFLGIFLCSLWVFLLFTKSQLTIKIKSSTQKGTFWEG